MFKEEQSRAAANDAKQKKAQLRTTGEERSAWQVWLVDESLSRYGQNWQNKRDGYSEKIAKDTEKEKRREREEKENENGGRWRFNQLVFFDS